MGKKTKTQKVKQAQATKKKQSGGLIARILGKRVK